MAYGWLSKRDLPPEVNGIPLDPLLPTRREEYTLVYEAAKELSPGFAVDLGCGYTPERHIAAPILASLGWRVVAVDDNPRVLEMPSHSSILWTCGSFLEPIPGPSADLALCISVFEHLDAEKRAIAAQNITNLVKDGGTLILTADEMQPEELIGYFDAFDFGPRTSCTGQLSPVVSFAVGKKGPRPEYKRLCQKCNRSEAVTMCTYPLTMRVNFALSSCDLTRCGTPLCETCRCHT